MPAVKNAKTQCTNGHPFTTQTTYVSPKGDRACRTCKKQAMKRYRKAV